MAKTFASFAALAVRLSELSAELQQDVKEIVEYNLGEMEVQAIADAPGPGEMVATQGGPVSERDIVNDRGWTPISQAIGYVIDQSGYKGSLYVERSAGEIAAWVEFSTGQSAATYLATTPPEWQALARKYYINGRGTIIGKPYILPAFFKYKLQFLDDLKDAMKNLKL